MAHKALGIRCSLESRCKGDLRQIADLALKRKVKNKIHRFGYSALSRNAWFYSPTLHSRAVGKHANKQSHNDTKFF
jgi:hypothetical protein